MTTQSTEEAMDVLNTYRRHFIETARYFAWELASKHPERLVDTREVRVEMEQRGYLYDKSITPYWLGAVFREGAQGKFVWTHQVRTYSEPDDKKRNIHERRPVKVWRLLPDATPPPQPVMTPWPAGVPMPAAPQRPKRPDIKVIRKAGLGFDALWAMTNGAGFTPEMIAVIWWLKQL